MIHIPQAVGAGLGPALCKEVVAIFYGKFAGLFTHSSCAGPPVPECLELVSQPKALKPRMQVNTRDFSTTK